tara:strand:- start:849 stop:1073 length:225 start_codon:yes stop_codon:yes gene_type:complete
MKVSQLLKPSVVDTTAFNSLSPRHKEVVTNFYNEVENSTGDIVNRVEKAIDKIATSNNVSTDIMYDYINKETGV